jgi:germination protein, Ger(x)C family
MGAAMKLIIKKMICLLMISSICVTFSSGCTNITELSDLGLILALGFDFDEKDNNFVVSIQLLNVDSKVNDNKISSEIYIGRGGTIFQSLFDLNKRIGKTFNYSHIQYMVISDSLARKGIGEIIDFSLRFNQMRPNIPLLITKGTAADILSEKVSTNVISAFSVSDLLNIQKRIGDTVVTTNQQYISSISRGADAAILGVINIDKSSSSNNEKKNYEIGGSALIKNDKLVGYFSTKETKGLNWVLGKISNSNILVKTDDGNNVSLYVGSSSSKIKTQLIDNEVYVKIDIHVQSKIDELSKQIDFVKDLNSLEKLSKEEEEIIYSEVVMAIKKAQKEFGIDVFDFGYKLYTENTKEWKKFDNTWNDKFKNAKVDIYVTSEIIQTGSTLKLKRK